MISPAQANRPTVAAAMRPAERVWTRDAIRRNASADWASQLQSLDSGGGRVFVNVSANEEAERERATIVERNVDVKL